MTESASPSSPSPSSESPSPNVAAHPAVLHLERITVRREGRTILSDLSWTVEDGEHWAVLGPNGSGKTTLLNVINGYLWPAAGSGGVYVLGRRYGRVDLAEMRRSIGFVSSSLHESMPRQATALSIVLSGRFGTVGLWDAVTAADRQAALSLLDRLGCPELASRPYGVLSQGQQQQVLIARALLAEPRLLILDEPCTGLDFLARETVLRTVQQMIEESARSKGGKKTANPSPTILYVTHQADEILPGFGKVLLLNRGRALAQGPKGEVLNGEILSRAYGVPLQVHWQAGRPHVLLAR